MGAEIGRISGPLLSANLLRNGVDLAFETELLYLDVNNGRIGVNTDTPVRTVNIADTTNTIELLVDTQADFTNITFVGNTIQDVLAPLYIKPNPLLDPKIVVVELQTQQLKIINNLIENRTDDNDIEITAHGTGRIEFYTPVVNVNGSLHATGNITFDGDVSFGSNNSDNVIFNADVASSIIPDVSDTHDIGSTTRIWNALYADTVLAETSITATSVVVNNISLLLTQGNTIYVSVNGSDTNTGDHLQSTFRTVKHALSLAQPGDEVVIFPGDYQEQFPLTVPQGVSVRGTSIRSVSVSPTADTNTNDAFLLNGETTISYLTVKDFYSPGNAFSFAAGVTVSSRSPYIQNVTVITQEIPESSTPTQITVGPGITGYSPTSNSVTLYKTDYSQSLVDSLVGQTAVINRYPNPPLIYTVVSIVTDPLSPTEWRMTVDATFDPAGQFKSISFYPDANAIEIVTNDIWDTTGNSVGEKWVAWFKTNLPVDFETTVQPGWTINLAGLIWIVDYVIEDPVNTNMWRIYVTRSLEAGVGIPIFSSPTISAAIPAGNGALIDGSFANNASNEASMLFHNVTMIVPNAIGIKATNGARVEWLNSFTYYATRGIYLTQGTLGFASQGIKFGAEIRSINSANVYGEFGAVADGPDTLGYLIGHNFGYVGTGTNNLNDRQLAIQANEIVEINNGTLYYDSMDHKGDYRIGDIFYVNQETGNVVFNAQAIDFTSQGSIGLEGPDGITFINAALVQAGNIKIYDNNIDSLTGSINVSAASGLTYLNTNVNISGLIDITGDTVINGSVYLGDTEFDLISLTPNLTQDIIPGTSGLTLGKDDLTDPKFWNTLYLDLLDIDAVVQIDSNIIRTTTTDTDLILAASGTGNIQISLTDVEINNQLTVTGLTSVSDIGIIGNTVQVGNTIQVGNTDRIGNTDIVGTLTVDRSDTITSLVQFQDIKIDNNLITTIVTDSDLELVANGSGIINVINTDVLVDNDLTVSLIANLNSLEVTTTVTGDIFDVSDVYITDNYITTLGTNQNLLLQANNNGIISVPLKDVLISNKLNVNSLTTVQNIDIVGNAVQEGNTTQTGNVSRIGNTDVIGNLTVTEVVKFDDVEFNLNILKTTLLNNNLEFRADGAGIVKIINNNVTIDEDLAVLDTAFLSSLEVTTTVTGDIFDVSDVYITDNYITTLGTNQNLLLQADGTGIISVPLKDVLISNSLSVNNTTDITDLTLVGNVTQIGSTVQQGNVDRIGDTDITGLLTVRSTELISSVVNFNSIRVDENTVSTFAANTDLELYANGTGSVNVSNNHVDITNDLTVLTTGFLNSVNVTTTVTADIFDVSDVYITDNYITTLGTNQNLLLQAAIDKIIYLSPNDVAFDSSLSVNDTVYLQNLNVLGLINQAGAVQQLGNSFRIGNTDITGNLTVTEVVKFDDVEFNLNILKTTLLNSDLIIDANGAGVVRTNLSDVEIENDLTITLAGNVDQIEVITTTTSDIFDVSDVYITDNYITTLATNQNLLLQADGAGIISVPLKDVEVVNNLTVDDMFTVNGTTSLKNTVIGTTLPSTAVGSAQFSGSNYLSVNGGTGTAMGTGDFTWECWVYPTSSSDYQCFIDTRTSPLEGGDNTGFYFGTNFDTLAPIYYTDGLQLASTESMTLNAWNHVALTRNSGTVTLWVNGVSGGTQSNATDLTQQRVFIGGDGLGGALNLIGNISNLRIVKGTAVYTSSFTVPTTALTAISGTQLLLLEDTSTNLLKDSSTNNFTVTNNGTVAWSVSSPVIGGPGSTIPKTLTQTGNFVQTGNINVTGTFANNNILGTGATSTLEVTSLKVDQDQIISTGTDADLVLAAAGIGNVLLNNWIKISSNNISNIKAGALTEQEKSIVLAPNGTGNVAIDSVTAISIPVSNNTIRVLNRNGEVRFNDITSLFEGYQETGTISLYGVYDQDRNTYITPELTQGLNDNILRFAVNGVVKASIDNVSLTSNILHIDNVKISSNSVSSLNQTSDITFVTSGTTQVVINDIPVYNNTILNDSNGPLVIENIGVGYVKFSGVGGVVIPSGITDDRRGTPDVGELRYNTGLNYAEVWTGTAWIPVIGVTDQASLAEVGEISDEWSLILG